MAIHVNDSGVWKEVAPDANHNINSHTDMDQTVQTTDSVNFVNGTFSGTVTATAVYNAVYNDLAEFRLLAENEQVKPGYCYFQTKEGLKLTTENCQMAVIGICSDTYGFALGKKDNSIPIGISGWVLAKTDKDYPIGTPLTCDKEGILTEMTMEQKMYYPERLIAVMDGIITEEQLNFDDNVIEVNGRHWVKI